MAQFCCAWYTTVYGTLGLYEGKRNWLPAPKRAFNRTMRLYGAKSETLTGRWNPPAVTKARARAAVQIQ